MVPLFHSIPLPPLVVVRCRYYSGRRMWRTLSMVAPSLKLSPTYGDLMTDSPHPYPFAVRTDSPLSLQDIKVHQQLPPPFPPQLLQCTTYLFPRRISPM